MPKSETPNWCNWKWRETERECVRVSVTILIFDMSYEREILMYDRAIGVLIYLRECH